MKSSLFIEYSGKQLNESELISKVKELWLSEGNKIKEIKSLNLYVKPEESTVYYVINDSISGSFPA